MFALVSMGLGVLSVLIGVFVSPDWKFIMFVAPIAIAAIVMGVLAMKSVRRGMAIAGIVLGVLGLGAAVALFAANASVQSRCKTDAEFARTNTQCLNVNGTPTTSTSPSASGTPTQP